MTESTRLTPEILKQLSEPFPNKDIGLKIQATWDEQPTTASALVVPFIDARNVIARLNEVVGGDWNDDYESAKTKSGLECALTICGVTRRDVGSDDNPTESDKSAYSDSFKRAAVKFGVGLYLYDLPKLFGNAKKRGKSWVLADGEDARLRRDLAGEKTQRPPQPSPQPVATQQAITNKTQEPKTEAKKTESTPPPAVKAKQIKTGTCSIHDTPTILFEKNGETKWFHKLPDGTLCEAPAKEEVK